MGRVFLIRADGNSMIGMGHLMRCLTVASSLRTMLTGEERVLFVCADDDSAEAVRERGFEAASLGGDYRDLAAELPAFRRLAEGLRESSEGQVQLVILADSYYLTDDYCSVLQDLGTLFCLDDLQKHAFPADGVINYNVFADPAVYENLYHDKETDLYLGGAYVPVREEFTGAGYVPAETVHNVLITTGGGDTPDVAGKVLRALLPDAEEDIRFRVVAGRFNPNLPGLKALAEEYEQVDLLFDVKNIAELREDCDLAITAGGTTVYELAAIGVPLICLSYAENQEGLTEYIGEKEIAGYAGAFHLDEAGTVARVEELFKELVADADLRRTYFDRERALIDGQGARRIAEVLHQQV